MMAGKQVKKEVQKGAPRARRRLKRSVRRTLGALLLASSIAVAAIPTDGLEAKTNPRRTASSVVISSEGKIPTIAEDADIYMSGDSLFRFAFHQDSGNLLAVILGFNSQTLPEGKVVIPEQVEPYMKFTNSLGTSEGYVAVGGTGRFLYWKETRQVPVSGGDQVKEEFVAYHPCYASEIDQWGTLAAKDLYFDAMNKSEAGKGRTDYQENDLTSTDKVADAQRKPADVAYIGNQYVEDIKPDNPTGIWHVAGKTNEDPSKGVFAENNNITTLEVSDRLRGIGDYAFYRCGSLTSVTLANGLSFIAEGAFENCSGMTSINLDVHSNLTAIAQKAFCNCAALGSFTLPLGVQQIGDSAFEECKSLQTVDLLSGGPAVFNQLTSLGQDVFKNCESLQSITFPRGVTEKVYLSMFQGCISLRYISTMNPTISFVEEEGVFTYKDFKKLLAEGSGSPVDGAFYFQGIEGSALHQMARENCFAFSYISVLGDTVTDLDRYELTVQEVNERGEKPSEDDESYPAGMATYEVNSSRHLTRYSAGDKVTSITIPSRIGPYPINVIDAGTFRDKCHIKRVEIPANVQEIGAAAFQGCHNLENVIFKSGDVSIGDNAFSTQTVGSHELSCSGVENADDQTPQVKLKFTGPVSETSGPFNYAMSARGKYNAEGQKEAFITYYTGWPTNMEIQYNPETDMSELVNFPSLKELRDRDTYTSEHYAYMDKEHEAATTSAVQKYEAGQEATMTDMEKAIIDAAVNVVIPEGVDSVRDGLFKQKEEDDTIPMILRAPKTVTAYSLKRISCRETSSVSDGDGRPGVSGTFVGCEQISSIVLLGDVDTIDDHAFLNCKALNHVELPPTVSSLGIRPFGGCPELSDVSFGGGPYYSCENSIIYELTDGEKTKIVECLEGRSNPRVSADEIASVKEISPEAFMGTHVMSVDFSQSTVTAIPERAFMDTQNLMEVTLSRYEPKRIEKDAFTDSTLLSLVIPGERAAIHPEAFGGSTHVGKDGLWFYCEEGSDPWNYAENYGINHKETKPVRYWNVKFVYYDDAGEEQQIGDIQEVLEGGSATPPEPPERPGLIFLRWTPLDYMDVYRDMTITANYVGEEEVTFTVTFLNEDGSKYAEQKVKKGEAAIMPMPPYKKGYVFVGWRIQGGDGSTVTTLANIQSDLMVQAVFRVALDGEDDGSGTQTTSPSPAPGTGGSPTPPAQSGSPAPGTSGSPAPGTSSSPNPSGSPGTSANPNPSGSPSPGAPTAFYVLTVQNGSGSGSYPEGAQPVIIANDPAKGQEFDYWSVSPEDVKIASKVLSASIITMPAKDVTVTAHYRVKATGSSSGGGNTGSSNSNQRPNGNSGTANRGGTTVVIDKNGISNTGVVSATVNGSSDNFTVKISESAEATEAALRALMAEYGDNLDNIKFFPMDISLYDSTGTTKITDTTGLSVSLTLPLPDSLIAYAGNNRVAGVVNDRLDKLSARFTTIQGVSCVTFTAEHFSPYVIYVNTGDLSSGLVSDDTPKTGDFIHPKWFLSIALACLSFVFFMQRDTRKEKKGKVKAKA